MNENPFLSGVHWSSGIEIGLRLIAWTWIRRLLNEWYGAGQLFERNSVFLRQLYHHQSYLAAFESHGSSANNHLIAEKAGQFISCCSFPYFAKSQIWRARAARTLQREIARQTFSDGVNRELATAYHCFVLELSLAAAIEGEAANQPLGEQVWVQIQSMIDALAAMVDSQARPPRQGDSDDATALMLDHPAEDGAAGLLNTGRVLFGSCQWWPKFSTVDARTTIWTSLAKPGNQKVRRPARFPAILRSSGIVILRHNAGQFDEIWCRCDHGPHGFSAIAAHAHADALSIELRYGGVEVLVDPGTYCYHGEKKWRNYFRSTVAHNTMELDNRNQSKSAGPFMWIKHASSELLSVKGLADEEPVAEWTAQHDGYQRLSSHSIHQRTVRLYRPSHKLLIEDHLKVRSDENCRLAFHLGPEISCQLEDNIAQLKWESRHRSLQSTITLPRQLIWEAIFGDTSLPLGWYSPRFGKKVPIVTLIGSGVANIDQTFVTSIDLPL